MWLSPSFLVFVMEIEAWTVTQVGLELLSQCCCLNLPSDGIVAAVPCLLFYFLIRRQSHVVYSKKWTKLLPHWFTTGSERLNSEHLAEKLSRPGEQLVQRHKSEECLMCSWDKRRSGNEREYKDKISEACWGKIFQSWSATNKDFN